MKSRRFLGTCLLRLARELTTIICIAALVPGSTALAATQAQLPDAPSAQAAAKIPADQLDSLVAPIALYPDPLLSQVLVASTYPLEVIQLQQWLAQNKGKNETQLADAVKKQDWDPSIQGLAALPDVVKLLAENIKWTTDLGNAFLAQQNDVMDAVQRMRKKAQDAGNLKSTEQQKVEIKTVESKQVIVVEQANPQVVYVPSYNPTVVYGALRFTRILRSPTRRRDTTPQAWPSRSVSALRWERCGAAVGVTTADGVATTTSPSTTTTISSTTATAEHQRRQPQSMAAIGVTAIGSTTRSTAAELLTATEARANKFGGTTRGDSMAESAGKRPAERRPSTAGR